VNYCRYFQAHLTQELVWFATSALRGYEHIVFDRTLDPETSLFEFFVPPACITDFLEIMQLLRERGVVHNLVELPNRLLTQDVCALPADQAPQ
jgi:hypothetical protein